MAVSRDIRTIWVTNYDKSIGDVLEFIASGAGNQPFSGDDSVGDMFMADRSTVTGVHEITKAQPAFVAGTKFWGEDTTLLENDIDYNLSAVATTITLKDTGGNFVYDGVTPLDPGYLVIENEIMKYTGIDTSSPWKEITGVTRGQFNTEAVIHDASAVDIAVLPYLPGSVQSIEYDPEDEVYAVGVAIPYELDLILPEPNIGNRQWEFLNYRVFRFEIPKDLVDLVVYDETEYATTIDGWIAGFMSAP